MRLDTTQYEQIVQSPTQVGPVKRELKLDSAADALAFEYKITHNATGPISIPDIIDSIIIMGQNVRIAISSKGLSAVSHIIPDYLGTGPLLKVNTEPHDNVSPVPGGTGERSWILPVRLVAGTYEISHKIRDCSGIAGLTTLSVTYRVVPLNAAAPTLRFQQLDAQPTSELSIVVKNANYIAFPVVTGIVELHVGNRVYTYDDLVALRGLQGKYANAPAGVTYLQLLLPAPMNMEIRRQNTTEPIYIITGVVA